MRPGPVSATRRNVNTAAICMAPRLLVGYTTAETTADSSNASHAGASVLGCRVMTPHAG